MLDVRDTVVAIRLDRGSVQVADMLVSSGVARSRSEALARLVQIGIGASGRLLDEAREAATRIRSLREEFDGGDGARATFRTWESDEPHEEESLETEGLLSEREQITTGHTPEAGETPEEMLLAYKKAVETAVQVDHDDGLDIFQAAVFGETERVVSLADSDPGLLSQHDKNGWTPLHLAAFFDQYLTAIALLGRKANPSAKSANLLGATPLHAAVYGQSYSTAEMLFLRGADMNAPQSNGWTPLHLAAYLGDAGMVQILLRNRADPSLRTNSGETAFDFAMMQDRPDIARWLAGAQSRRGRTRRRSNTVD